MTCLVSGTTREVGLCSMICKVKGRNSGDGADLRKQSGDTGNTGQTGIYDQCADFHGVTFFLIYRSDHGNGLKFLVQQIKIIDSPGFHASAKKQFDA